MKQITLNIPDNKYSFFLELIKNLGIDKIEESNIPEDHKNIVGNVLKNPIANQSVF